MRNGVVMNEDVDNETLARVICEQREYGGQRFERGVFVAIAQGRVFGVGRSFDDADAQLQNAGIEEGEGLVCEVTEPTIEVVR